MATGSTAWISGIAGTAFGVAIGFAAASFTRSDAGGTLPDASARHSDAGAAALSSRVDEILERLRALEQAIRSRGDPAGADAPAPSATPVRQEEGLRELIETRFKELEEQIRRTSAGLGELSLAKSTPDAEALTAFGKEYAADRAKAMLRLVGYSHRDAVQEFGSPTRKVTRTNAYGPRGGKVDSWIWELPATDTMLWLDFEAGVACYGSYGSLARFKEFIDQIQAGH